MQAQHGALTCNAQPSPSSPSSPVIVLDGPGVSLRVQDGQLHLNGRDGAMVLNRGTNRTNRVLVLSRTGSLSLSAIRWCEALGVHLAVLDGETATPIMQTQLSRSHDTKLRRAQAAALDTPIGLEITKCLLGAKCQGQYENLSRLGYGSKTAETLLLRMELAGSLRDCLTIEAKLASVYWDCWSEIVCKWNRRDLASIPEHWRAVGQRTSIKSKSPRAAITPVHAILNYLYRLAEIETTIALHAVGLDPGFAFAHTDFPNRNSMALDLLEAIRPTVDAYVLNLVESRTFAKDDFTETAMGEVRMSLDLRRELGATMPRWQAAIAPVVERVANLLRPANAVGRKVSPTPLTRANARKAQATRKARSVMQAQVSA